MILVQRFRKWENGFRCFAMFLDVFVVVYQDFLRFSAVDIVVFRLLGTLLAMFVC